MSMYLSIFHWRIPLGWYLEVVIIIILDFFGKYVKKTTKNNIKTVNKHESDQINFQNITYHFFILFVFWYSFMPQFGQRTSTCHSSK